MGLRARDNLGFVRRSLTIVSAVPIMLVSDPPRWSRRTGCRVLEIFNYEKRRGLASR
jgi:uncharacterized protein (UPF0548 family)